MIKNNKRIISLILLVITLTTAILPTNVIATNYTVNYNGKVTYGLSTVGKFYVNGKQAFCMDHKKTTPPTGTVVEEDVYNDDNILKCLYYGWGGDQQWSFASEAQGIVYTTLALDYFKNGNTNNTAKDFINYVNSMPVPEIVLSFTQNNLTAYLTEDNMQRTQSITVKGNSNYYLTISLQEGVTLVNETKGTEKIGDVNVYGGDTFYLKAPLTVNGSWTSNNIQNHKYKYQPIVYKTSSNSHQDLAGGYKVIEDQTSYINLKVEWLSIGTLIVNKVDKDDLNIKIPNTTFALKDKDGNVIETKTTDSNGNIVFSDILIGEYTLVEIESNDSYVLEKAQIPVSINAGVNNITITNRHKRGKIKVIKTSEDDNFINGEKAGTPIPNVKFEVYDSNKNKVDEITTDEEGIAFTKNLNIGSYIIKEVKSGKWYLLNENEYSAEIVNDGDIIEVNITNESEKPSVDIEKTGIIQTTVNQEIKYDFKIKNTGNIPLDKFTWYDYLPSDYVRMTKLITGTYNQDLNYSIYYKTNKNDYSLLKDNLNTQINNYIDFSNLKLEADEYVTEFKVDFGTVDVGFESVINPYIFVKVNSNVQNDDIFTNKTRIEGYNNTYLVWDEDEHTTKVYEKEITVKKLPRTGF